MSNKLFFVLIILYWLLLIIFRHEDINFEKDFSWFAILLYAQYCIFAFFFDKKIPFGFADLSPNKGVGTDFARLSVTLLMLFIHIIIFFGKSLNAA